jgi:tRNA A37 threonylcarbamoyladenosine biosynthesis protein TsaE
VEELALGEQARDGVLLVEWPERGIEALPAEHLLVIIEPSATEPAVREITLVAAGERYLSVIDGLQAAGMTHIRSS